MIKIEVLGGDQEHDIFYLKNHSIVPQVNDVLYIENAGLFIVDSRQISYPQREDEREDVHIMLFVKRRR